MDCYGDRILFSVARWFCTKCIYGDFIPSFAKSLTQHPPSHPMGFFGTFTACAANSSLEAPGPSSSLAFLMVPVKSASRPSKALPGDGPCWGSQGRRVSDEFCDYQSCHKVFECWDSPWIVIQLADSYMINRYVYIYIYLYIYIYTYFCCVCV